MPLPPAGFGGHGGFGGFGHGYGYGGYGGYGFEPTYNRPGHLHNVSHGSLCVIFPK